jgi:F420-dependent oxidoreductase-like protein
MSEKLKLGFTIPQFNWPGNPDNVGEVLSEIARTAEKNEFESIWVMDHFFQLEGMLGPAEDPMLEAFSTLGYLAGQTKKVSLGPLVIGAIYRNPGLLVKAATTLDVVSGGRLIFGVGAGWYEREAKGLGFPFYSTSQRFELLGETLEIAKQMWSGDTSPYNGKFNKMEELICSPKPVSKPHPPILIGGNGEKRTLRLVAEYGDACNLFAMVPPDELARLLNVLRKHCEDVGRDYDDIEKTCLAMIPPNEFSNENFIEHCKGLAGIGFDHIITAIPNVHEIGPIEEFGKEIIPVLFEL